jgi:hypothetical protein
MANLDEILKTVNLLQKQNESLISELLTKEVQAQMTDEEKEFIEQTKSAFKITGEDTAAKFKELSNLMERHGIITNIRNV